ncbi:Tetratricopeptide repeat-containing protein [Seinonella peptonophila]|uniref:Tetratricopeptide repeat-containing protein n=1 Tax=Seinonella peptonophila TaxID=112248 RepID=A0A1M4ZXA9_9BACL|nr:tetratricopeptide repeat protein [Seinonella peptonophila]SHF22615.1 Tetratricopeptide repeat-containing protein [Seinonella peptonophila]
MDSLKAHLYYLKSDLPSFSLVRYFLNHLNPEIPNQRTFYNRLTRGFYDSSFFDISYISDLGLRRMNEPTLYFLSLARKYSKDYVYNENQYDQVIKQLFDQMNRNVNTSPYDFVAFVKRNLDRPAFLNHIIRYYVDILGDWIDADVMAIVIVNSSKLMPKTNQTALLVSNCGNLLAHTSNALCRDAYQLAYSLQTNPYHRFTNQFRIAVAEIKRLHQPSKILSSLKRTKLAAKEFGDSTNQPLNTTFCYGLIHNLEALYYLKQKKFEEAGKQIKKAWSIVKEIPSYLLAMDQDIANRYRIQIIENLAFFAGFSSSWETSIPLFIEAVDLCRQVHPHSLAELLSMLGYACIQLNKYEEAISVLEEADQLRLHGVAISKANEVRKMLAVAHYELRHDEQVEYWLDKTMKYQEGLKNIHLTEG